MLLCVYVVCVYVCGVYVHVVSNIHFMQMWSKAIGACQRTSETYVCGGVCVRVSVGSWKIAIAFICICVLYVCVYAWVCVRA